jgi:UPF0716 protein FxsA
VLMLIPGYLTDTIGLVLFLPGIRTLIGALILKRISARGSVMMGGRMPFGGGMSFGHRHPPHRSDDRDDSNDIIEGDFEERPADRKPIDRKD